MSFNPTVSLNTVGNLTDLLKDLPLPSPVDFTVNDDEYLVQNHDNNPINLFDTTGSSQQQQQSAERAMQMLSITDPGLADSVNRALSQIDTSKISMKPSASQAKKPVNFSPLLYTVLNQNHNLFKGQLKEQFEEHLHPKMQQSPHKQKLVPEQHQQVNKQQNENSSPNKVVPKTEPVPTTSMNQSSSDPKASVSTNKFYSSKPAAQPPAMPAPNKPVRSNPASTSSLTKTTNQLSTWQADIKSQLDLPEDFTPELIAQLASEGYDIIGAQGGRKPRPRQTALVASATTKRVVERKANVNMEELSSSSDEDQMDADYDGLGKKKSDRGVKDEFSKPSKTFFRRNDPERMSRSTEDKLYDGQDPTENSSFKRFNQLVEEILETYEQDLEQISARRKKDTNGEDAGIDIEANDDIPPEYLLNRQVCAEMRQEASKVCSYGLMDSMKKENLVKLQNLLYFNIKDGFKALHLLNEDQENQEKLFKDIVNEKISRALDCSLISMFIMTSPRISTDLIIEDLIEQIVTFAKQNLAEMIYPNFDPVYKPVASQPAPDVTKTPKRKLANQFNSTSSLTGSKSINKLAQHLYHKSHELLSLFADLVYQTDMTDIIIITMSTIAVGTFFVDNISDLQLESLRIITCLFTRYAKHRQLVLDDIYSSFAKLHTTGRTKNLRNYKCSNGVDAIQMFSAFVLQLIQSEVNTIDFLNSNSGMDLSSISFEEKETHLLNSYSGSCETAKKFLAVFFSKCKTKQADFDFRPVFENFIQDLLVTVNKPEWPIAETILNLLGMVLVNQIANEQSDVSSRVNSLEYLGQIVSQLRKDSLEYQNHPERIYNLLTKLGVKCDKNSAPSIENLSKNDLFSLQKALIIYLDSMVGTDALSLKFAKFYLVAQWLQQLNTSVEQSNVQQDQNYDQERVEQFAKLEEQRKNLYYLIDQAANVASSTTKTATSNVQLDSSEAFILSKYLASMKKTIDKNFDYYLINILKLTGANESAQTPTQVRSKAIKCLSSIIEADPQILLKPQVFHCVQTNFLHQTISVREASVDLIGRFITLKPELTNQYYKLLSDRILDIGVSVRRRTIKVFRDVCINQPDFEHQVEICVKILRRINDEDSIKKLVIDHFYSIWFSPISSSSSNQETLLKRVLNLVDVVSELNVVASNQASIEIFEQLFNALLTVNKPNNSGTMIITDENVKLQQNQQNSTPLTNEQESQISRAKEVLKSCKQIVDCLIKNVLNTEANTASPQAYKRLVASFTTLFLLSKIKPENLVDHTDTLLPYLNIKATNDNLIINNAARILECVVPLLKSPSNSFLVQLEESLCKLIFQGGMLLVSSCISCLGAVVNKLTKNYKLAADCFTKFYNGIVHFKKTLDPKKFEPNVKPHLFRMLFTLGLLAKHFELESLEFKEFELCSNEDLFFIFLYFIKKFDAEIQLKALNGLGSFLSRHGELMTRDEIKTLYLNYIRSPTTLVQIKSQVFANLTEYLHEEDQKNMTQGNHLSKTHFFEEDNLKEMQDVEAGMASSVIQTYLLAILEAYISTNATLRMNAFNCLSIVLDQGLIFPNNCTPYLIAMTTDPEKSIQSKALTHLTNLSKSCPNLLQSNSISGVRLSFMLQKLIKSSEAAKSAPGDPDTAKYAHVVRGYIENTDILSLNHHLYALLRVNRSYRRIFAQQLLKIVNEWASSSSSQATLSFMLFITDNLAYFPYQLMDEPLYIINNIDMIISTCGINLIQSFRENLLNYKPRELEEEIIKPAVSRMSELGFDGEEENMESDEQHQSKISSQKKKSMISDDDDEQETFESVFANLPNDLKPLIDCMYKSQGCCLLLVLKQFLKEVYSINDAKVQSYCPSDSSKVNDRPITGRKTNRKFNPKQIIDYMIKWEKMNKSESGLTEGDEFKSSLVNEYLEFKELIMSIDKEDSSGEEKQSSNGLGEEQGGGIGKVSALQQRLMDCIEKTSTTTNTKVKKSVQSKTKRKELTGLNGKGDSGGVFATPTKSGRPKSSATTSSATKVCKSSSKKVLASSSKKKKSKRKRDSDYDDSSDGSSEPSDFEEEL